MKLTVTMVWSLYKCANNFVLTHCYFRGISISVPLFCCWFSPLPFNTDMLPCCPASDANLHCFVTWSPCTIRLVQSYLVSLFESRKVVLLYFLAIVSTSKFPKEKLVLITVRAKMFSRALSPAGVRCVKKTVLNLNWQVRTNPSELDDQTVRTLSRFPKIEATRRVVTTLNDMLVHRMLPPPPPPRIWSGCPRNSPVLIYTLQGGERHSGTIHNAMTQARLETERVDPESNALTF